MTAEQLLWRRFRVIADFWRNPFNLGIVLTLRDKPKVYRGDGVTIGEEDLWEALDGNKYPDNFQELAWYEGRLVEDMPPYVRMGDGKVYHVGKWVMEPFGLFKPQNEDGSMHEIINAWHHFKKESKPATEEEYLAQPRKKYDTTARQ